jgi:hypothetical protein
LEGEAEDRGKVLRLNAKLSIEYGDFKHCLVMKEFSKLSPGNIEHKYYGQNVGLVYIKELREKTVLVELVDKYSGPPELGDLPGPPDCDY